MRPPVIRPGQSLTFINNDALPGQPEGGAGLALDHLLQRAVHRRVGVGYPLANGPVQFDSGQLGYGGFLNSNVTTGSNAWTTPPLRKLPGSAQGQRLQARHHLHVLLPPAPLHAGLVPGSPGQVAAAP